MVKRPRPLSLTPVPNPHDRRRAHPGYGSDPTAVPPPFRASNTFDYLLGDSDILGGTSTRGPTAILDATVPPVDLVPGFGFHRDKDGHVWELFHFKWFTRVHSSDGTFAWERSPFFEPSSSASPSVLNPGFWKDSNSCIWELSGETWWHHKRDTTGSCRWIFWPETSNSI